MYKLKNADTTFYSSVEVKIMPAPTSVSPEEREFAIDSRTSMHMMKQKRLKLR